MGNLMTWTAIARAEHNGDVLRFLECLTDREWALIAPMMPPCKGLEEIDRKLNRLRAYRFNPHAHPAHRKILDLCVNF
jgi:hypothetical protein